MPIHLPYRVIVRPLFLMLLLGCGTPLVPATTDGPYLDFSGDVVHYYMASPDEMVQAGLLALQAMRVPVDGKLEEDGQTLILAAAPDGSALRVRFVREGRDLTAVKVRTGLTGYWDQEFSHQLHALIQEEVKRSKRSAPATVRNRPRAPEKAVTGSAIAIGTGSDHPEERPAGPVASAPTGPVPTEKGSPPAPIQPERTRASVPERSASSSPRPQSDPPSWPTPHVAVYFDADSNFPGPGEMAKLEAVAVQLTANPTWSASLVGFANDSENKGRPGMVAESRVLAVKFYLVGKGIDADRLSIIAEGEDDGQMASDAQVSRRVDIYLVQGP